MPGGWSGGCGVTLEIEALVSPIVSALVVGATMWFKSEVEGQKTRAAMQQRIDDKEQADRDAAKLRERAESDRHAEYCRRFDRLERKAGVTNGGGEWVDREFCREVHRNFSAETGALRAEIHEAIEQGREAVRIGHEDREGIKQRLTRVEVTLEGLTNQQGGTR